MMSLVPYAAYQIADHMLAANKGYRAMNKDLRETYNVYAEIMAEIDETFGAAADRIEALEAQLDDAHRHMREAGLPVPRTTSVSATPNKEGE